jgi:hypothetical protein
MEVYFRIKMLDIMSDIIHYPSKKELLEMSNGDLEKFRSDLSKLQDHIDAVNQGMDKAYRDYNWVFRGKSAADSDGSRPANPIQVRHLFRLIPATP